ncbi:MAG: bifunctional metallophosphatase/5'-nucleotidase, partial [Acutalibacteraceae bacterium]
MKRFLCFLLVITLLFCGIPMTAMAVSDEEITILFTHDTHDYLYPTTTFENGKLVEHGGAARLKTLLKQYTDDKTIYVDGGDFSMGTLYQSAYTTDAYELRNLGLSGCAVTTLGNHEFDYGVSGLTQMLRTAMNSGDALPQIVQSNIDFSGELTKEQQELKSVMDDYGVKEYTTLMCGGYKVGIFGLAGIDCIEYMQDDINWINYIEAAKKTVASLKKEGCDVIVALSHSGTKDNGARGEDINLAKSVDGIDLIISAHSHSIYEKPVTVGDTVLVSGGEYLKYLGKISFTMKNGKLSVNDYRLIPIDSSVEEDPETAARIESYKQDINENYLAKEGVKFDDVICHSNFNLISLSEMYDTHQEYTMGN